MWSEQYFMKPIVSNFTHISFSLELNEKFVNPHYNYNKRKLMEVNQQLVHQKHDISIHELTTLHDKFVVQGKDRTCG